MSSQNAMAGLQAGLVNYLGAAQQAIPEEGLKKNRAIVAMLMDLILMTAQPDKTKPCHIGILEPLLQGIANVLVQHQQYAAGQRKLELIVSLEEIISDIDKLRSIFADQKL